MFGIETVVASMFFDPEQIKRDQQYQEYLKLPPIEQYQAQLKGTVGANEPNKR